MKTISDIINDWKTIDIPLEEGVPFNFEKDCEFIELNEGPKKMRIVVKLKDLYTHFNDIFHNSSILGIFETTYQDGFDIASKDDTNREFELFLHKFTEEAVRFRRMEIEQLRMAGRVNFRPLL